MKRKDSKSASTFLNTVQTYKNHYVQRHTRQILRSKILSLEQCSSSCTNLCRLVKTSENLKVRHWIRRSRLRVKNPLSVRRLKLHPKPGAKKGHWGHVPPEPSTTCFFFLNSRNFGLVPPSGGYSGGTAPKGPFWGQKFFVLPSPAQG